MLDGTGDTACDIDLGADCDSRLSYLQIVVAETGINCCAACAYLGMQHPGQIVQ